MQWKLWPRQRRVKLKRQVPCSRPRLIRLSTFEDHPGLKDRLTIRDT